MFFPLNLLFASIALIAYWLCNTYSQKKKITNIFQKIYYFIILLLILPFFLIY